MKSYTYYIFIVFILRYFNVYSQTITNVQAKQDGDQVIITYDLSGDADNIILEMNDGSGIYRRVQGVKGDWGINISKGKQKEVIWEPENAVNSSNCIFRIKISDMSFVDKRDEKKYKMVEIGTQIWMAENLNYNTSSGSWCYDDNSSNCAKYGRLYDWETAKKVCPIGWHLPSNAEWTILTDNLGGEGVAGEKMKFISGWNENGNGTNTSGFAGSPGGARSNDGALYYIGNSGYWWSSTESSTNGAWNRNLYYSYGKVNRDDYGKKNGLSVRCLRDL